MTDAVRLATRGSRLARQQAETVRSALETHRRPVELVEVETRGDQIRDELIHRLGRTGAFVRALDERVLDDEADAAVHSMKDMPTDRPAELVVAGVPERAPAGDVLVTPGSEPADIDDLPRGATVGTSSLRRGALLRRARDDLTVEPLRGNVDTRVEKLLAPSLQRDHEELLEADDGNEGSELAEEWFDERSELERRALGREVDPEYDAIVLAEAGLSRLGLLEEVTATRLDRAEFVPAPGQGAIAVVAREGTDTAEQVHSRVDDPRTRVATTVERTVLAELGGGCIAPIGVAARLQGEYVHVDAVVCSTDGTEVVARTRDLPVEDHAEAAAALAADMAEEGAADLIDRAREAAEGE
ncbi:MAG: hydroxymethylbilane synthase [Haloferacaceae archaeon]